MSNVRERLGAAGVALAGTIFRFALYICIAVVIFWAGKSSYQFAYSVFNEQAISPGEGQEITVVVSEGDSAAKIGRTLENKGLISDARVFWVQELLSNYHNQIKPGTYVLSTAYTPSRMIEIMAGVSEESGS